MKKLIRFKNFLTGLGPVEEIREQCQPFLGMTDKPLFRGIGFTVNPYKLMSAQQVRKNRSPRDASRLAHEMMDDWFDEHLGIRPRSQGLFCTSIIQQAQDYGSPCFVFPVGSFKYVWGVDKIGKKPIQDTLSVANRIYREDLTPLPKDREHARSIADNVMQGVDWHTDSLKQAQEIGAEITLICDHYYLVPVDKKNSEQQYLKITRG